MTLGMDNLKARITKIYGVIRRICLTSETDSDKIGVSFQS